MADSWTCNTCKTSGLPLGQIHSCPGPPPPPQKPGPKPKK